MQATPYAFVPRLEMATDDPAQFDALAELLRGHRVVVLTGAGCSTESGIPDYRGPETRRRARNPVRFAEFVGDPVARRRYWARAFVGYRRFANRVPNAAHMALVAMERDGLISGVITQNVDGLHERAGSRRLVALHGQLSRVQCLDCGDRSSRADLQSRLAELNAALLDVNAEQAPDGDAELADQLVERFTVADCEVCGGALKPSVVFFGENVPRERVEAAFTLCDEASALLVVGSSLMVYSGLRFVRRMHERAAPIGIVTVGESRGDDLATLKVQALAGLALPALYERLRRP